MYGGPSRLLCPYDKLHLRLYSRIGERWGQTAFHLQMLGRLHRSFIGGDGQTVTEKDAKSN